MQFGFLLTANFQPLKADPRKNHVLKEIASYFAADNAFEPRSKITDPGWYDNFMTQVRAIDIFEGNPRALAKQQADPD